MDYIKKKICLEGCRTRTQGLMPYYVLGKDYKAHTGECGSISELGLETAEGDNGNWGQFVANPCFLQTEGKSYETMIRRYYNLLNMVRDGVKLRRVDTKNGEVIFTEDLGTFYYEGSCFSGGTEPDYLYDYAAYDAGLFTLSEINSLRDESSRVYRENTDGTVSASHSYVVLVKDYEAFCKLQDYLDGVDYSAVSDINIGDDSDHYKWARYCRVVDSCIGRLNVPASIFTKHLKAPKSMAYADIESYLNWLNANKSMSGDCCSAELWEEMGGQEMLTFLNSKRNEYQSALNRLNAITYAVPCMEIPLLLTQDTTDIGVLSNVNGVYYDSSLPGPDCPDYGETRPHGIMSPAPDGESGLTQDDINGLILSGKGVTIDQIVMGSGVTRVSYPTTAEYLAEPGDVRPVEVESLLRTLRSRKKYTDDNDNVLPGLFARFDNSPSGQMFKCEYGESGWTLTESDSGGLINGDGMPSETVKNSEYYRTITVPASGVRIAEVSATESGTAPSEGDWYYFKAKYSNSEDSPMTLPYIVGNMANLYFVGSGDTGYTYRGDSILSADTGTGKFVAIYVTGGYFTRETEDMPFIYSGGTGDIYTETITYAPDHLDYVVLDGVDNVPIWSNYIDFAADSKEFYSTRYGLYRTGNTANIIEADTAGIWNRDYAYDAYLCKEDYLVNFSCPPKVDINVTIDRGGVSAFEKHYKLSECNTMQDLVNYGNNFFNL